MGHKTTQVGPGGGPGDLEGFWGRVIGSGGGHPGPTRPGQGVGFGVGASSELQPVLGAPRGLLRDRGPCWGAGWGCCGASGAPFGERCVLRGVYRDPLSGKQIRGRVTAPHVCLVGAVSSGTCSPGCCGGQARLCAAAAPSTSPQTELASPGLWRARSHPWAPCAGPSRVPGCMAVRGGDCSSAGLAGVASNLCEPSD